MPKINQEEYDILQFLNNTKNWIVRNPDGQLWAVEGEAPWKATFYETWKEDDGQDVSKVDVDSFLFQFIQWEDESPYNIQELIEEYLYDNRPKLFVDGQEQSFEFIEESEEKEVKKQKMIEKWESAIEAAEFYGRGKEDRLIEYMRNFVDDLNQLDEPEVLSSDWISKNVEYAYFDMLDGSGRLSSATAIIKPEKLKNLLVPKKEVSMIPNYVAKWISRHHEQFDLYPALKRLENNMSSWENVYEWYRENTRNFVNAYLTGEYEIEQEQKYYAKIKGHENIGSNDKYWNYNTDMEELSIGDSEVHPNVISEYMIKATKDEWANLGINDDNADFVKVEELEE